MSGDPAVGIWVSRGHWPGRLTAGLLPLLAILSLGACSGNQQHPPNMQPPLTPGQWYNSGQGKTIQLANPFDVPAQSSGQVVGYVITKPGALADGQTITLNYSVSLSANAIFGVADPNDEPPATVHLFVWRNGDDLSCNGAMVSYRFWDPAGRQLQPGDNQTLSGKLDSNVWTNCYGKVDANGFAGAIANAFAVGWTFGGHKFYGHGVDMTAGNASIRINSFTVQ